MHAEEKLAVVLLTLGLAGCGSDPEVAKGPTRVTPAPFGEPFERLSSWHLFADARKQQPAERVEPYEVSSPLWSDAAWKHRFIHLPEGAVIGYSPTDRWAFPVGAILVKTFAYPVDARDASLGERPVETRLLVHEPDGWVPLTYVWNGNDAALEVAGADVPVAWIDEQGESRSLEYSVPNTNMCKECHGEASTPVTLGGRTRQLNRNHDYATGSQNQIDHLAALGWLDQTPAPAAERETLPDPFGDAPVAARARSYLDANCSHCHQAGNAASSSGVYLDWPNTDSGTAAASWGLCKTPTSAGGATCGLTYDIVPGAPEQSILICRVKSREPKVQMPPLATKLTHAAAVALLSDWISGLSAPACN